MGKVKVIGEIDLDRYYPQSWPGRVRTSLKDGSAHTREIIIPKGEKENPISAQEVEENSLLGHAGAVRRQSAIRDWQNSRAREIRVSQCIARLSQAVNY